MSFDHICEQINDDADEISRDVLERWAKIADHEPWLALPGDLSFDHLPDLVRGLASAAACGRKRRDVHPEPIRMALKHGETRRNDGFDEDLVFREYHLLRRAIWDYIRERWGKERDAVDAIMRLDSGITVSTAASLRGFHRDTLEAAGRWDSVVQELFEDWPFPDEE